MSLALLLGACGGSGPGASRAPGSAHVTATAYVTSLCRAVGPFERDVATRSGELSASASGGPVASKARLVSYLSAIAQDSAAAAHRLAGAGLPEVNGGGTFARTVLSTFGRLHTALARSATLAAGLPTSSPAGFRAGAVQLATAVRMSIGQLGASLSTRSNAVLDQTAGRLAVCHTL